MTEIAESPAAYTTDALVERLFNAAIETVDLAAVYIGDRAGFYTALKEGGPATAAQLAERTGTVERYVREWLEQQGTSGILAFDSAPGGEPVFSLPAEHAEALTDPSSLASIAPIARAVVSCFVQIPAVMNAFRKGGGVPWSAYGEMREAQADFNRPLFEHQFVNDHLAAVPGLMERLSAPGARVAEIGFGGGWASISLAKALPGLSVDGFDNDAASVELATQNAAAEGVEERATFHNRDAGDRGLAGNYDLVFAFECIHDMSNPVQALESMRRLVSPGGTVLVVDERVGERFGEGIGDPVERLMYGFSILCCLPNGMADEPSAATGTVMRPATLERYAREAGFQGVDVLPIEHDLFRFYRLNP